jgi:hypothetical protein
MFTYIEEEFENTKGAIRICISKKNRQHNGQKKKYKRTNVKSTKMYSKMSLKRFIDCIWDIHICGSLILSWCMELYFAELEPLIICRTRDEHVNHHATDVACVFYMFSIYSFNISCIEWHFLCKCNAQLNIYYIKVLYHWPLNELKIISIHLT